MYPSRTLTAAIRLAIGLPLLTALAGVSLAAAAADGKAPAGAKATALQTQASAKTDDQGKQAGDVSAADSAAGSPQTVAASGADDNPPSQAADNTESNAPQAADQGGDQQAQNGQVVNAGQVSAGAKVQPSWKGELPTKQEIQKSGQTIKVVSQKEIEASGPLGGAAQALEYAPGVHINGYGQTSATKYSISINGIKQGWGGEPSGAGIDYGSLDINFDDVPINEPGTGLWQSPYVNQMELIQGINVTYGPGSVADRWYNAVGGSVDFVPVQPADQPGAKAGMALGSYDSRALYAYDQSGASSGGWSLVTAAGANWAHSFREGTDGYDSPSRAYTGFIKLRKQLENGTFSIGVYSAKGIGFRPNAIPVSDIPGVTVNGIAANGTPIPGELYSQTTSGFYSQLPFNVWHKEDSNTLGLLYSKLNLNLSDTTTMHSLVWYELFHRLHIHYNDYQQGAGNLYEYNNPFSREFGERLYFDTVLPYNNTLTYGGSYMNAVYNSRQSFYNPADGGGLFNPNAHYRDGFWYLRNAAGFIQDAYKPVDNLTITPGLRVINYQTDYYNDGSVAYPLSNPANNQGTLPNATTSFSKTEDSLDVNWQVTPEVALYANYGTTYRQPGNGGGGGPYQTILASTLQLEKGQETQGGVKMHLADYGFLHDFFMQANVYTLDFDNQAIGITNSTGNFQADVFGSSQYRGFNLYADNDFAYNVHGFVNLSLENASFSNYTVQGGLSYNGLPVAYVPHTTFNLGVYTDQQEGSVVLEPNLWYQYTGAEHMFDDVANTPSSKEMPSYGVVNASLDVKIPVQGAVSEWDLSFQVLNLLNKQYNNFAWISAGGYFSAPASVGQVLAYPGAPRTVFFTASATF